MDFKICTLLTSKTKNQARLNHRLKTTKRLGLPSADKRLLETKLTNLLSLLVMTKRLIDKISKTKKNKSINQVNQFQKSMRAKSIRIKSTIKKNQLRKYLL